MTWVRDRIRLTSLPQRSREIFPTFRVDTPRRNISETTSSIRRSCLR